MFFPTLTYPLILATFQIYFFLQKLLHSFKNFVGIFSSHLHTFNNFFLPLVCRYLTKKYLLRKWNQCCLLGDYCNNLGKKYWRIGVLSVYIQCTWWAMISGHILNIWLTGFAYHLSVGHEWRVSDDSQHFYLSNWVLFTDGEHNNNKTHILDRNQKFRF